MENDMDAVKLELNYQGTGSLFKVTENVQHCDNSDFTIYVLAKNSRQAKKLFEGFFPSIKVTQVPVNGDYFTFSNYYHYWNEYSNQSVYIYTNNQVKCIWNDSAQQNCPEDLTWSRMIGSLFAEAFELGQKSMERKLIQRWNDVQP